MRYIIPALFMMTACADLLPDGVPVSTLPTTERWTVARTGYLWYDEGRGSTFREDCKAYLKASHVYYAASIDELHLLCLNENAGACTFPGDPSLIISLSSYDLRTRQRVLIHESTHILAFCGDGDPDADHGRPDLWEDFQHHAQCDIMFYSTIENRPCSAEDY